MRSLAISLACERHLTLPVLYLYPIPQADTSLAYFSRYEKWFFEYMLVLSGIFE